MMAQSYDTNEVPANEDETTPSVEHETECAKLYLKKFCPAAGDNLYDHLSEVLCKILLERPKNPFASFEEYSRRLRDDKFKSKNDRLRDVYVPPHQYDEAKKLIKLFKANKSMHEDYQSYDEVEENEEVNHTKQLIPNVFELLYYFEQTDVGLPRAEIVLLNLSIRKLVKNGKIKNVRFWGKILGRPEHYYVLEANLSDFEIEQRLMDLEEAQPNEKRKSLNDNLNEDEEDVAKKEALELALATKLSELETEGEPGIVEEDYTLNLEFPPVPENTWKPLPEVPPERLGTGANTKVYFVCNKPGFDDWVELPMVTPQEIVIARQITHLFTGNLEAKLHTFPPFPGSEKNYLRAQIARIGAATHVSPIGYFTFGRDEEQEDDEEEGEDEEEEEEEEEGGSDIVKNRNYEALPMKNLIDPSMAYWCHHAPYLLNQGRVTWQDPGKSVYEDEDEEMGDEEENEVEEEPEDEDEEGTKEEEEKDKVFEKEIGPPLLTPLSEDAATEFMTPWTARQSSKVQSDTAVAFIRSNVWPGAYAIAADRMFANLYVGWGQKHQVYNYSPPSMPDVEDQYPISSEIQEIQDPSFAEEEAYRIAHLPPPEDDEEGEEENTEEEITEEED